MGHAFDFLRGDIPFLHCTLPSTGITTCVVLRLTGLTLMQEPYRAGVGTYGPKIWQNFTNGGRHRAATGVGKCRSYKNGVPKAKMPKVNLLIPFTDDALVNALHSAPIAVRPSLLIKPDSVRDCADGRYHCPFRCGVT